jgi:hypothetical protein
MTTLNRTDVTNVSRCVGIVTGEDQESAFNQQSAATAYGKYCGNPGIQQG